MAKKKIAVFSTGWAADILAQFMRGMYKELSPVDTDIYLFMNYATPGETEGNVRGELNIMRLPDLSTFDGAVVISNLLDYPEELNDIFDRCRKAGIPFVSHGLIVDGVHSVVTENDVGMRELVQHLITDHGVRKIKFIGGSRDNDDCQKRLEAVRETALKNGLEFTDDNIVYTNWDLSNSEAAVIADVRSGNLPDAYLCANDELAMSAVCALERENLSVPKDAIVTGFDCLPEAQVFYPSIASVDQKLEEHGMICARQVMNMLSGGKEDLVTWIPCSFREGESCGCSCPEDAAYKRLRSGTNAFRNIQMSNAATWHCLYMERVIMGCDSYTDIKREITATLSGSHNFEGNNFHILFDPSCYRSDMGSDVTDDDSIYSEKLDVIVSIKDGNIQNIRSVKKKDLIPGIREEDMPHLYIFLPVHERGVKVGYVVFVDCFEKIESKAIREFMEKFNSAIEKARKAMYLKAINESVRELSHIDALTHVKNRNAYETRLEEARKKASGKNPPDFGIVLFDINNLKKINDELGHYSGDEYIKNACQLICTSYKSSPVYRIGGDEFVVILEGKPYQQREDLLNSFKDNMNALMSSNRPPEERVSIAYGMSVYEGAKDSIDEVVKRADVIMYDTKKKMKKENR
ncbi:MAG: GGDEF domain-containing protein [Lachnospiraceae bacterium]|nr:GGDEF domain-containing protein [Lachnospiraceae bacterium]